MTWAARKYRTWIAAAFVAFYVITQPDGAVRLVGDAAGGAADGLASAAGSLTAFVDALGS
ncbi:hypothetical protein E1298_11700 [Actinomadura rubrisoli]|uniref:Uncharacterized protein n=2 Tax=Actinomadura rubrisoli TaxID=2530368 RepID=A0A4R5C4B8_9ACTN|nr:hypothetical protein E1298_11700 [Actinomadura rubrisoli]